MIRYSTIKNEGILPFPTTQLDLEGTVLTDKSQSEKNKHSIISLTCGIQKEKKNLMLGKNEGQRRRDEMIRYHHRHKGHESEQTKGDSEGQKSRVCCSPRGHKDLDTT